MAKEEIQEEGGWKGGEGEYRAVHTSTQSEEKALLDGRPTGKWGGDWAGTVLTGKLGFVRAGGRRRVASSHTPTDCGLLESCFLRGLVGAPGSAPTQWSLWMTPQLPPPTGKAPGALWEAGVAAAVPGAVGVGLGWETALRSQRRG